MKYFFSFKATTRLYRTYNHKESELVICTEVLTMEKKHSTWCAHIN